MCQYIGLRATICEGVEGDINAEVAQSLNTIKNIDYPTIVGRIRDIERDDM